MDEPFGITKPPIAGPVIAPAASAPVAELLTPPPALPEAATFMATVLERRQDGALLLRSSYGLLALRTAQPFAPGAHVELRVIAGNPPTLSIHGVAAEDERGEAPPMRLALGTNFAAIPLRSARVSCCGSVRLPPRPHRRCFRARSRPGPAARR
jgi:hypothetical protein